MKTKSSRSRALDPRICTTMPAVALSGDLYVKVSNGRQSAWTRYALFASRGALAFADLAEKGMVLFPADESDIRAQVQDITEFEPMPLIERPGWSGGYFALPNGIVRGPPDEKPIVVFQVEARRCQTAGGGDTWLEAVSLLSGQTFHEFALMLAFTSPLLDLVDRTDNFGFEFVGDGGIGKSTIQQIAASVVGNPFGDDKEIVSLNATHVGLEDQMPLHNGMPLILEEAAQFHADASDAARAKLWLKLVFHLADGFQKRKYQRSHVVGSRFVYFISTNDAVTKVIGEHLDSAATSAAFDRLMSIPIEHGRQYQTFDSLPEGFSSGRALAEHITNVIKYNHGWAFRRFVRALVEERARSGKKLRKRIRALIESFCNRVGVDMNDGSAFRVAQAFALVSVAGYLAREYGALPDGFHPYRTAKRCYMLNRHAIGAMLSPYDEIVALSEGDSLITLKKPRMKMSDAEFLSATGFIRNRKGAIELLVSPEAFKRQFKGRAKSLLKDQKVNGLMIREKDRKAIWRQIRIGNRDRVYCFRIPF